MSLSQGESNRGQTRVKLAGVDPRLVAGKARDGGERRDSPSDDQKSGGGALRDAQARAHLTRLVAAAGVDRARRKRARGGGRSSANGGLGDAGRQGGVGERLCSRLGI